ncbi:hypothetical protein KSS87_005276 [Heliosperma pusillum]|nr:hypothetical protein KSS87_005276 [Heliosperma pusillum]
MGSDIENDKSNQKEKNNKTPITLAPISKPLASKKLCKRTFKLVRRAAEQKCLKRGVKEVVKSIRRGNKGWYWNVAVLWFQWAICPGVWVCVIAGNISPIDVITHVPILCEENDIPYVYVPTKEDLASAGATKRPTCCVLVLPKLTKGELSQEDQDKLKADYDQVASEVRELASSMY